MVNYNRYMFSRIILITFLILFFLSCNTKKSVEIGHKPIEVEDDTIVTNEIKFTNNFIHLLNQTKDHFRHKYHEEPRVVTISFTLIQNEFPKIIISNQRSLYPNKQLKEEFDTEFIGATMIDNTLVLIEKTSIDKREIANFYTFRKSDQKFILYYDGNMNSCTQQYKLKYGEFILEDSYCSFDL